MSDVTSSSLAGGNVRRTRSYGYASDGSSAKTLVGTNKSQTVFAAGWYR